MVFPARLEASEESVDAVGMAVPYGPRRALSCLDGHCLQ